MVGKTVRVTSPSRSRPLSVKVSIRCEMLPSPRRSSLKRFDPSPSRVTTSTVHLSPTRASTAADERLGEVRRILARDRDLDVLQLVAQQMHGPRQPLYPGTGPPCC